MTFVKIVDGKRVWTGPQEDLRSILVTHSNPECYSPAELAEMSIYELVEDATLPEGARVEAESLTVSGTQALQTVTAFKTVQELADEAAAMVEDAANRAAEAVDPVVAEKYAAFYAQCTAAIGAAMAAGATVPEKISYETLNEMLDVLCDNPATKDLQDWLRMSVRLGNSWSALVVADGGNSAMTYERMPILERRRLMDAA
jgi:hypothetical protein